jgi:hypothetical protein
VPQNSECPGSGCVVVADTGSMSWTRKSYIEIVRVRVVYCIYCTPVIISASFAFVSSADSFLSISRLCLSLFQTDSLMSLVGAHISM